MSYNDIKFDQISEGENNLLALLFYYELFNDKPKDFKDETIYNS